MEFFNSRGKRDRKAFGRETEIASIVLRDKRLEVEENKFQWNRDASSALFLKDGADDLGDEMV